jgi:6-pyruvoyl-tetrahydropterin synthase
MYGIVKAFKFESSHRLLCMPEGHPCSKIHGHSYVVRVSIYVEDIKKMPNPNMVVDFGLLKKFQEDLNAMDHAIVLSSKDPMLEDMDKKYNQKVVVMPFELDPTAENMAFLFANSINQMCLTQFGIKEGNIQLEVDETVGNTAIYMREIGGV